MATETNTTDAQSEIPSNQSLQTGLSALGGGGLVVMILALAVGVIDPNANSASIGMLILLGAGMLIVAVAGWVIAVQPHQHFDDINVPLYGGHHTPEESELQQARTEKDREKIEEGVPLEQPGEVAVSEPGPVDHDPTA